MDLFWIAWWLTTLQPDNLFDGQIWPLAYKCDFDLWNTVTHTSTYIFWSSIELTFFLNVFPHFKVGIRFQSHKTLIVWMFIILMFGFNKWHKIFRIEIDDIIMKPLGDTPSIIQRMHVTTCDTTIQNHSHSWIVCSQWMVVLLQLLVFHQLYVLSIANDSVTQLRNAVTWDFNRHTCTHNVFHFALVKFT